jgi:hypothetical protein
MKKISCLYEPSKDSKAGLNFKEQPWKHTRNWLLILVIIFTCSFPLSAGAAQLNLANAAKPTPPATPQGTNRLNSSATATRVYGQPNFTSKGYNQNGNVSANTLAQPGQMVTDSQGGLYIADTYNNRVLYYSPGVTTASRVYGQVNFTTSDQNHGGISATSLSHPYGVALDSSGGLYVADMGNSRVLYYPSGNTTATRVYGQPDFTTNEYNQGGVSATSLAQPYGVALDSSNNLYIADTGNNRVLYYSVGVTTANQVYGQPDLISSGYNNSGDTSDAGLGMPQGVALDSANNLYVADTGNSRVLAFSPGITTPNTVYGQPGFVTGKRNNNLSTPQAYTLNYPNHVQPDNVGGLYIADSENHRVLYYSVGVTIPQRIYGQIEFNKAAPNFGGVTASSFSHPSAAWPNSSGGFYVADWDNNRVLYYPASPNPNTFTIKGGNNQSIVIDSLSLTPLTVQVKDSANNPVKGLNIVFTAPSSGPGWTATTVYAATDVNGIASPKFLANSTTGSYTVSASVVGLSGLGSLDLNLTNVPTLNSYCQVYNNAANITVAGQNTANPYPSNINVANFPGAVGKVTVTLNNLSHSHPGDLHGILVDPSGTHNSILLEEIGGSSTIANVTLTFDDQALVGLGSDTLATGNYQPSLLSSGDLPTPAPKSPYNLSLANFKGINANGNWALYLYNNSGSSSGSVGGWSLQLCQHPTSISITSGSNQNAYVSTDFAKRLVVQLKDSSSKAVSNTDVVFTAPASSASGTFDNGTRFYTGTTDLNGVVTSTVFTANSTPGRYTVSVVAPGFPDSGSVSFNLANNLICSPIVDKSNDDGNGDCGTLSGAIYNANLADHAVEITFSGVNHITVTGPLPIISASDHTITIAGTSCANPLILTGNAPAGTDGLRLAGGAILKNITVEKFTGRQIVSNSAPGNLTNKLGPCVVMKKS